MQFANFPAECRALPCWVLWKLEHVEGQEKPTKVPYGVNDREKCDITKPWNWASFDDAVAAYNGGGFTGIGFCFHPMHPYCGIDLDATTDPVVTGIHDEIARACNSYTELSPSGNGRHIIIKGDVGKGAKYGATEIYSQDRYFTVTGNVIHNVPVCERYAEATAIAEELRALQSQRRVSTGQHTAGSLGTDVAEHTDQDVFDACLAGVSGAVFQELVNGAYYNGGGPYASGSEADIALMDILQNHSNNREQMHRMFLSTEHARLRPKLFARPKLVEYILTKAFDRAIPPVEYAKQRAAMERLFDAAKAQTVELTPAVIESNPYVPPPGGGLLDMLARFIYANSPRPIVEISLAGAIGFLAGIVGSAFNIGGAGLNQYLMVVTTAGMGKEAMASGIDKICSEMAKRNQKAILQFRGPSEIASGPALNKAFKTSPSFLSILGEFGYRLQELSSDRATGPQLSFLRSMLDIYGKSGKGKVLGSMAYSDTKNNVEAVKGPALTFICESSPEILYGVINEKMVRDGLLPRFVLIEHPGTTRAPYNDKAYLTEVTGELIEAVSHVMMAALSRMESDDVCEVLWNDPAKATAAEFNAYCDHQFNTSGKDAQRELWTRSYLKAAKLAALAAVGVNPYTPTITRDQFVWAKNIVMHDVTRLLSKFAKGEIGTTPDANVHSRDMAKAIVAYLDEPNPDKFKAYQGIVKPNHREHGMMAKSYLATRCRQYSSFKKTPGQGAASMIEKALKELIAMELISQPPKTAEHIKHFGAKQDLIAVNPETLETLRKIAAE